LPVATVRAAGSSTGRVIAVLTSYFFIVLAERDVIEYVIVDLARNCE